MLNGNAQFGTSWTSSVLGARVDGTSPSGYARFSLIKLRLGVGVLCNGEVVSIWYMWWYCHFYCRVSVFVIHCNVIIYNALSDLLVIAQIFQRTGFRIVWDSRASMKST